MKSLFTPLMVVDNFFVEPNDVRDFALSLSFKKREDFWPGKRTEYLHDLSSELFNGVMQKITGLLFSDKTPINYSARMSFQLIDKNYEKGWVHTDSAISSITAIVYLTPGSSSGTSLYFKNDITQCNDVVYEEQKIEAFKTRDIDSDIRTKHNSQYSESISIKGLYNRMFLFESHMYHAAHEFFGDTPDSSRLTLVSFIDFTVPISQLPIIRSNKLGAGI
jgi:hypothetical protein